MRILLLLDECVPVALGEELTEHEVSSVQRLRWSGMKDSELLRRAVDLGFEAFVTVDQSIEFQQRQLGLALLTMIAPSNKIEDLRPLLPQVHLALDNLRPGQAVRIALISDEN